MAPFFYRIELSENIYLLLKQLKNGTNIASCNRLFSTEQSIVSILSFAVFLLLDIALIKY